MLRAFLLLGLLAHASAFVLVSPRPRVAVGRAAVAVTMCEPVEPVEMTEAPPAGLSAEQAAENPALAAKVTATLEEIAALKTRLDAFPKQEGTMYCARTHAPPIFSSHITSCSPRVTSACPRAQSLQRRTWKRPRSSWPASRSRR